MRTMPEIEDTASGKNDAGDPVACGLMRRLLVMAYDCVAVITLMMLTTAALLLTPLRDQTAFIDPLPTVVMMLTWFFYLAWCWRRAGLTLGMRAWRVRLLFEGDETPGWGRCLLRFLVSLASAAALGLGFVWCLFNPARQSWHDLASRSRLVRTRK